MTQQGEMPSGPADRDGMPSAEVVRLVACPLCGVDKGYRLDEGSIYRWWSVKCAACGQEVAEARCNYPTETTPRTTRADDAWNDAGAYAAGLRSQIAEQTRMIETYMSDIMRDRAEIDRLRADAARANGLIQRLATEAKQSGDLVRDPEALALAAMYYGAER